MKGKIIAASAGLLALGLAGAGYWYLNLARAFEPRPVPATVLAVEDALAVPGLLALMHFDVDYAVRAERAYRGPVDENALPGPLPGDNAFLQVLQAHGLHVRELVDQALAAMIVAEDGAGFVTVLLGRFSIDRITEVLEQEFQVEHDFTGAHAVIQLTKQDRDTCRAGAPVTVHVSETRIALANDPLVLRGLLDRLDAAAAPERDLSDWRAFRAGKVTSLAFISPPLEVAEAFEQPLVKAFAEAMEEGMSPIRNVYAGLGLKVLPPAIDLEGRIDTDEPAWPLETMAAAEAWRADLVRNAGAGVPSLVRLHDRLHLRAEDGSLHVGLSLNEDLAADFGQTLVELIGLGFSNMGVQAPAKSPRDPEEELKEETLPPEDVPPLVAGLSHDRLAPFDAALHTGRAWQAETGPFGLRIAALRLSPEEPQVLEIELAVTSEEIPTTVTADSARFGRKDARAEVFVTRVLGRDGRNLLRAEPCGPERNERGAELHPDTGLRRENGASTWFPNLEGTKTVRLEAGAGLEDIASVEGYVRLGLPAEIEARRVSAPLAGEVVETPDLRIRFREAKGRALSYDVSGATDRLLEVRALNRAGDYLASAGSSAIGRFLSAGKTVTRNFKGEPVQAELIIAHEQVVEDYAFVLDDPGPRFPEREFSKPGPLAGFLLEAFTGLLNRAAFGEGCDGKAASGAIGPFRLCASNFQKWSDRLFGNFKVWTPDEDMLRRHLSALEIIVESVRLRRAEGGQTRTVGTDPASSRIYVSGLSSGFGKSGLKTYESFWATFANPDDIGDEGIVGVQGRLSVRLPKELATMTLDVTSLGNTASHGSGAKARLTGYEMSTAGKLVVEFAGPRDQLVELVARDAAGRALGTAQAQVEATDDPETWTLSVSVSGRPAALDFVLAVDQHRKDYPFDLPIP